jgi:crotonobetainyl-CoA:carnitine CoA-transferase CaiB-like acyl-CoA transferase
MSISEVSERLDKEGITYGAVQKMADVLRDEQLRAAGIVIETEDPGDDYRLTINSPINVKEAQKKIPSRAPDIGANSLEVLRDLDFEESYIQELLNAEVIVSA